MTGGDRSDGSRLVPLRDPAELTAEQRALWESVAGGPRAGTAVRAEGQLTGPFDVLLRSPETGIAVSDLGARLRFDTTLGPRLTEIVILTVAARWRARFAWLRHETYALREGITPEQIGAIARHEDPGFDDDRDRAAWSVADALVRTGAVADDVYDSSLAALGERTLVEAVALSGYYCLSSFILNTFRVPLPDGETTPWEGMGT